MARRFAGIVAETPNGYAYLDRADVDAAATKALVDQSRQIREHNNAAPDADESHRLDDPHAGRYRKGLVAPRIEPGLWVRAVENNATASSAIETIAQDVAGDWTLEAADHLDTDPGDTAETARRAFHQWARRHPLRNPDRHSLSTVLVEALEDWHRCGALAVEIVYDAAGQPAMLTHVPAHTVRVHESRTKYAQDRYGTLRWFVDPAHRDDIDVDWATGDSHDPGTLADDKRATALLYLRDDDPYDDWYGSPPISATIAALFSDQHRAKHVLDLLRNGGEPRYAVLVTGDFDRTVEIPDPTDDDPDRVREVPISEAIEHAVGQLRGTRDQNLFITLPSRDDPERTAASKVDIEFKPLGADRPADAEWRGLRDDVRDEVLTSYRVPPYRVGIAKEGSLGGSTARESTRVYAQSVVRPLQERLEALLDAFVVDRIAGESWSWRFTRLDTRDRTDDSLVLQRITRLGAVSLREVARHFAADFDLDPERVPDVYVVDGWMYDPEEGVWQPLADSGDDGPVDEDAAAAQLGVPRDVVDALRGDQPTRG